MNGRTPGTFTACSSANTFVTVLETSNDLQRQPPARGRIEADHHRPVKNEVLNRTQDLGLG